MSIHEYAISILSIVLGLGVANLLGGIAWMTRNPSRDLYYYVFGIWSLSLMLATLGMWWAIWSAFKSEDILTFWSFLPAFLCSALLYLATEILVPKGDNRLTRPDENFPLAAKPLYICMAALFVAAGLANPNPEFNAETVVGALLVVTTMAGVFVRTPIQHLCVAILWLGAYLTQQSLQPSIS